MVNKTLLTESVASPVRKSENRWMVTVATPGQGSSGYYSEDLLREQGPSALSPGAQSFINHDSSRNPKDMIGIFPEGAFWNQEERKLQAELEVYPPRKEFVEAVGPYAGMSLYMRGNSDEEGNVVQLTTHAHNGCHLVARPRLEGAGLEETLYESRVDEAQQEKEDGLMEDLKKTVEGLATKLDEVAASLKKAEEEVNPEELVTEALESYQAKVDQIDSAGLLPSQVKDLRERAKVTDDIEPLIESAKTIKDELEAQVKESRTQENEGLGNVLGGVKLESAVELGKVFD